MTEPMSAEVRQAVRSADWTKTFSRDELERQAESLREQAVNSATALQGAQDAICELRSEVDRLTAELAKAKDSRDLWRYKATERERMYAIDAVELDRARCKAAALREALETVWAHIEQRATRLEKLNCRGQTAIRWRELADFAKRAIEEKNAALTAELAKRDKVAELVRKIDD